MRLATKPASSKPRMGSPAPVRLARPSGQPDPVSPAPVRSPAPAPAPAPAQTEESLERGWLRIASLTESMWLDADESQRRFRLQAAATITGTAMTAPEREEILQRIDAHSASETGLPQPVYRGVGVETAAPVPAPAPAGTPYDVPSAGVYRPAGQVEQSGPSTGTMLVVAGATLAAAALISQATDARPNPKRKKSWWDKAWDKVSRATKKRKKASGAKRRVRRSK